MYIEKQEFEKTVNEYSDLMLRCAYIHCGNRTDAEDIVQEAFIKYLRKSPEFSDEEHKKAWLLRVVINLCKDLNKSFWRRKTVAAAIDPETADNSMTYQGEVWDAVNRLPLKYRTVIELYYNEDMTIEEIAQVIDNSKSTVCSLLQKARKLLKKQLEEN